jgi:hypothetical protein
VRQNASINGSNGTADGAALPEHAVSATDMMREREKRLRAEARLREREAVLAQQLDAAHRDIAHLRDAARQWAQREHAFEVRQHDVERLAQALQHITSSSCWRATGPARRLFSHAPRAAKVIRQGMQIVWWSVTLQLATRHRLWIAARRARRAAIADGHAGAGRTALMHAPAAGADAQAEAQAEAAAETLGTLAAIPGNVAELAASLVHAHARLDHVARQASVLEARLSIETDRMVWALTGMETAGRWIGDYHAFRASDAYRRVYRMEYPMVSICIATMNRAPLLIDRAIRSVLAQTYGHLQIVVVGDHCTDDTAKRLHDLNDARITFVNLPERGPYPEPGPDRWCVAGSNAMNRALSMCTGDFITHLDDDDAMTPERIETLVKAALRTRADFLWHAFWNERSDGSWGKIGNGALELAQVSTGSIFYHRYFSRVQWDVRAYWIGEPGDWNRIKKIRLMRPRLHFIETPLLYHHAEQSQSAFVAQDGETFLE